MLRKTLDYKNFNDENVRTTHYFHLSGPELIEMEMAEEGSLSQIIQRIIDEQDASKIITMMKDLILTSYGIKSADGERFEKSEEIRVAFSQTKAFEVLYMQLATDDKAAAEFLEGIMPADAIAKAEAQVKMQKDAAQAAGTPVPTGPAAPWTLPPSEGSQPPPPPVPGQVVPGGPQFGTPPPRQV